MSTPASDRAEEFLRRIFPEAPDAERSGVPDAERSGVPDAERSGVPDAERSGTPDDARPLRGVDERRQQLLEPIGDPDRESW